MDAWLKQVTRYAGYHEGILSDFNELYDMLAEYSKEDTETTFAVLDDLDIPVEQRYEMLFRDG